MNRHLAWTDQTRSASSATTGELRSDCRLLVHGHVQWNGDEEDGPVKILDRVDEPMQYEVVAWNAPVYCLGMERAVRLGCCRNGLTRLDVSSWTNIGKNRVRSRTLLRLAVYGIL